MPHENVIISHKSSNGQRTVKDHIISFDATGQITANETMSAKGKHSVVSRRHEMIIGQDLESGGHLSIINLLEPVPRREPPWVSFPAGNGYSMTEEMSRSNELLNAFLDRPRWQELL
jgi:hypothetical protein